MSKIDTLINELIIGHSELLASFSKYIVNNRKDPHNDCTTHNGLVHSIIQIFNVAVTLKYLYDKYFMIKNLYHFDFYHIINCSR